ncbi:MAG: sugar transferase [Fimbriimonadaceae bacterium]|nr:sugar transferase [Fimbriimonadaceae bacterium]
MPGPARGFYRRFGKRAFDLLATGLFFLLFWWVFLILAFLVWRFHGGPVLFRQERPGRDGKAFRMLKFRTMTNEKDAEGRLLPDDQRLTRFGALMRSTSLDELPEFINVWRGEMSLVGPRPLLMAYLPRYSAEQARRHEVLPGITGWAQVNGRNAIAWDRKFALDVEYVDRVSLLLDLRILLMTVKKVFVRSGIAAEGHATMPEFLGNTPE